MNKEQLKQEGIKVGYSAGKVDGQYTNHQKHKKEINKAKRDTANDLIKLMCDYMYPHRGEWYFSPKPMRQFLIEVENKYGSNPNDKIGGLRMNKRTGKECKQINCKNHNAYSHWAENLGSMELLECIVCKHAYISQYHTDRKSHSKNSY